MAHLAMPCDSFTPAGPQRGRQDEDTNLLEQEAAKLCGLYGGFGVPVVTYENVMEVRDLLFPKERFADGLRRLFPQYWIRISVLKAAEMERPTTGQVAYSTNIRIWAVLSHKILFDEPLEHMEAVHWVEPRVAAEVTTRIQIGDPAT